MAELIIENVSKTFPVGKGSTNTAVREVNLTAGHRELVIIVGPSGSGKTTLLRMIAGLETIDRGTITMDGRLLNGLEPKDRSIAMVFQNAALYPHMTVEENIAFPLKLRNCAKAEAAQRVKEAGEIVGLSSLLHRAPNSLSGGERQRVALARAIVQKPAVFLFDEPLSDLDAGMRVQMRREILRLHKRLSATTIYVTHDQVEAMTIGERIVVMKDGSVQQTGPPIEIYNKPASRFVAGFIGSPEMNFMEGQVTENGRVLFGKSQQVRLPEPGPEQMDELRKRIGGRITVGVRPENVRIGAGGPFDARVELIEILGADALAHLRTEAVSLTARVHNTQPLSVGEQVSVQIDMTRAHFFDPATGRRIC